MESEFLGPCQTLRSNTYMFRCSPCPHPAVGPTLTQDAQNLPIVQRATNHRGTWIYCWDIVRGAGMNVEPGNIDPGELTSVNKPRGCLLP